VGFRVDSGALSGLNRALNLSGNPDSDTELLDGVLNQTIDIGPIARRGIAAAEVYQAVIQVIHTATGDLATTVNPWVASLGVVAANHQVWPNPVPLGLEVWVIDAVCSTNDVTDFNTVELAVLTIGLHTGIHVINTAGVITSPLPTANIQMSYGVWDGTIATSATLSRCVQALTGSPVITVRKRLRRNDQLVINSNADTAGTVTNTVTVTLGLFPRALGQDAAF